ncbi:phage tail protein [Pseudomonas sp. ERGC3:01]|nr:phage tail protein [Pseudomonas sp. ERGC3:01]
MIDANSQFFAMLTAVGEAKQVKADAGLMTWKLTHMAVGDANNADPIPDRLQKSLINERRRAPLNSLGPDPANPAILVAEQIIPADEGGFWIRELGLFDSDGDLVAVANCAPSFKPKMSQGSGRTQTIRMNFVVKSSNNVVLLIDPAVVTATRKFVEDSVTNAISALDCKASVLVATTASIVLAGVQTIDGFAVPAGSRVLVKNQDKPAENGIYVVAAEGWVRAADADNGAKVTPGMQVVVERGTVNADTLWLLSTDGAIVVGTTALTFKNITQGLAPISSPAFLDNPTAPTAPLFDSGKTVSTTEFVQRALGNLGGIRVYDASAKLTALDFGQLVLANPRAAATLTLPPIANVALGATIHIRNVGGAPLTVVPPAGGSMSTVATVSLPSVVVNIGSSLEATLQGTNYFLAGSGSLKHVSDFAESASHQKLPGGDVEQWGLYVSAPPGSDTVIPLPYALSAVPTDIQLTFADFTSGQKVGDYPVLQARNSTLGSITVRNLYSANASFFWRVRGKA